MLIHKNFNQQVENILLKMTKRKSTDKTPEGPSKRPNTGHWSGGLVAATEDPKLVVSSDNLITVIKDGYPKAKHHYLVLPKENISSIKSITKDHLDLLKHMDKVGRELIQDVGFKIGYHAEPSMQRLHLHVISDDMDSPCVKTKKHWNSFTTEFFIDSKVIIDQLQSGGKIKLPSKDQCKEYMERPLKCHKCDYVPKHMPDLKKHILKHVIP
ncbi:unnamed protein product [Acanthoscelides obtectus]|uniref:HIT domain-containing protein n=1 Tax=Acanthoscelides obtectus TaxID=200917 RepID=A0A9P0M4P0_ACAOB|nr:unnamed protein product [Acanthoscelides obtectus]CAK1667122.1 Aprataxin [Acanthoscelides obtectus]